MRQETAIARISSTRISSRARTQSIPALVNSDQDERTDSPSSMADPKQNDGSSSDDDDGKGKSRRELPTGAVATLKAWLLSPEHFTHPYPTPQDQIMLMQKTGIDKKQLKNWFTNARRRIWKPMLKKQLEQGKLTPTGVGGGGVAGPGLMVTSVPGPLAPTELTTPELQVHYQQAVQQQQPQPYDPYGAPAFMQAPAPVMAPSPVQYYQPQYSQQMVPAAPSGSIGSLTPMSNPSGNIMATTMSKNDSHAVLMELFARDQDLVRQATESANLKAATTTTDANNSTAQQVTSQHPMKIGSQSRFLGAVPSLNSWPHFSSISSLNNLGTMTGVKSITSMSGADLASQGNLNKMGNLAQVKSMESMTMGKNDSYAFLEVFFGDRSMSSVNMAGSSGKEHRGMKRERDEDNDVGLSLDEDQPPTATKPMDSPLLRGTTPLKDGTGDTGTLKRAYDDALAARGLMSVSRSSERLTDLILPAKMQKTLSQEFLRQHQTQAAQYQPHLQSPLGQQYMYSAPAPAALAHTSQQYPGQHPQQQDQGSILSSDPSVSNASVEVSSDAKCVICQGLSVDTQLRPCGHMFHERCLKPSLQTPIGQPKCPIDSVPILSALLAVPTDDNVAAPSWNPNPEPSSNSFPAISNGSQRSKA